MNWAAIFWLAALVLFLMVEGVSVALVSIWFAAGALAALLVSLFSKSILLQTCVFLVASVALLCALRPLVRKYITPKITKTNVGSVIGTVGLVSIAVDNVAAVGQVKLGGMEWTARSTNGENIPVGTKVRVDRIEGVKAYVTPVEQPCKV